MDKRYPLLTIISQFIVKYNEHNSSRNKHICIYAQYDRIVIKSHYAYHKFVKEEHQFTILNPLHEPIINDSYKAQRIILQKLTLLNNK